VLDGTVEWQEAVQRFEKGGFDVLTCGPQPTHPVDLLMSERFQDVMAQIEKRYDIVIIDTPPVLAVTDVADRQSSANCWSPALVKPA
jgi:tyrosine-protein kinase Etk/Wzc